MYNFCHPPYIFLFSFYFLLENRIQFFPTKTTYNRHTNSHNIQTVYLPAIQKSLLHGISKNSLPPLNDQIFQQKFSPPQQTTLSFHPPTLTPTKNLLHCQCHSNCPNFINICPNQVQSGSFSSSCAVEESGVEQSSAQSSVQEQKRKLFDPP